MVATEIITMVGAGIIRNIAGFFENLLHGNATKYDLGKLAGTALKIVVLGLGLHYGFGLDAMSAAGASVAADFGLSALKKVGKKE